jgi:hypothetical protein
MYKLHCGIFGGALRVVLGRSVESTLAVLELTLRTLGISEGLEIELRHMRVPLPGLQVTNEFSHEYNLSFYDR